MQYSSITFSAKNISDLWILDLGQLEPLHMMRSRLEHVSSLNLMKKEAFDGEPDLQRNIA